MFCFDYHGDFDRSVLQIHNAHIREIFQYLLQIIRRTVQFQLTSLNLGEKKNGIYQLQQCISCIFYISDQRTAATFYLSFAKHDIADADNCMQWAPQIMAHACHKAAFGYCLFFCHFFKLRHKCRFLLLLCDINC